MKANRIRKCGRLTAAILSTVILFAVNTIQASAVGNVGAISTAASVVATAPRLVIDKYEVSNEKIVPGEDFTLTITLTNHNKKETARDVLVDIDNPNGVAPVYGTVSQIFLGDVGPGETKEISIDYNSWTTIVTDTLDFYVTVVNSVNQNYIVLRIPAGSDSPFSILSVNAPNRVAVDDVVSMMVAFKVLGDESVRGVVLSAYHEGKLIADSQIGILTAGITKTQQISTFMTEPGDYVLDLMLEYTDASGQNVKTEVGTVMLTVVQKGAEVQQPDEFSGNVPVEPNAQMNTALYMGLGGIIILCIFLVIVIIGRKK